MGREPDPLVNPSEWDGYLEASLSKPLHPLYLHAEPFLPAGGRALELGCGVGHGTLFLLERGFGVDANDVSPKALEILKSRAPLGAPIRFLLGDFTEISLDTYQVITAFFSLFWIEKAKFASFWKRLMDSLEPGGLFIGQLLGVNDEWAARGFQTFTRDEILGLFEGFELLEMDEVDRAGQTIFGEPKHWHVFHVIARRQP